MPPKPSASAPLVRPTTAPAGGGAQGGCGGGGSATAALLPLPLLLGAAGRLVPLPALGAGRAAAGGLCPSHWPDPANSVVVLAAAAASRTTTRSTHMPQLGAPACCRWGGGARAVGPSPAVCMLCKGGCHKGRQGWWAYRGEGEGPPRTRLSSSSTLTSTSGGLPSPLTPLLFFPHSPLPSPPDLEQFPRTPSPFSLPPPRSPRPASPHF